MGSVKTTIHEAVRAAGLENQFIGGHPMAGSERVGFVNSRASLLENAYYILTPSPGISSGQVEAFKTLLPVWERFPLFWTISSTIMSQPAVSHLPHVIASSLVHLVEDSDSKDGIMKMIAAGGFKDITRIASSSAAMWQQICLTNTENIVALLDSYMDSLGKIRTELVNRESDAIYDFFDGARIYRDSFINASSGPIKRSYCIHVDIADKAGALAHIVTMLAGNNISIKNVEITHNRESEDGVLRVEFYEEGQHECCHRASAKGRLSPISSGLILPAFLSSSDNQSKKHNAANAAAGIQQYILYAGISARHKVLMPFIHRRGKKHPKRGNQIFLFSHYPLINNAEN